MDSYLTKALKDYYVEDFQKVLNETREAWKLDNGIEHILVEENKNDCIQTLYSKNNSNSGLGEANESYLEFCYSSEVELKLFKEVIPKIVLTHNSIEEEANVFIGLTILKPIPIIESAKQSMD